MSRLVLLLALLLALLLGASAAPPATRAIFKRSCGECGADEYCEATYPGTPEGSIACVAYVGSGANRALLRRYD
ncbi:hypothetical protein DFJ74DRAFT_713974 [Hyaloraphidium curvatum]|nr:hypothetical protein DFJ74DRAFT_713974 [Hyaloraphidium curvatum]